MKRGISPLIATIIVVAMTLVMAVVLAGYITAIYSGYSQATVISAERVILFYSYDNNLCSTRVGTPCAILALMLRVNGGGTTVTNIDVGRLVKILPGSSNCRFYTSGAWHLDPGDNIIVVGNNWCLIVSKKHDPTRYSNVRSAIEASLQGNAHLWIRVTLRLSGFRVPVGKLHSLRVVLSTTGGTYIWIAEGREVIG